MFVPFFLFTEFEDLIGLNCAAEALMGHGGHHGLAGQTQKMARNLQPGRMIQVATLYGTDQYQF